MPDTNFREKLQQALNQYRGKQGVQEGYTVIPDVVKLLNTTVAYLGVPLSDRDWAVYDALVECEGDALVEADDQSCYHREELAEKLGIKEEEFLNSMSHLTSVSLLIRENVYAPVPFLFYEKLTNHHLLLEFWASTGSRPDRFVLDQTIKARLSLSKTNRNTEDVK